MGLSNIWVMDIIGPALLLILLVFLVIRGPSSRSGPDEQSSDEGTPDIYAGEQQRRRGGTDSF